MQVTQLAALHILFAALGFYSNVMQQTGDESVDPLQDGGTYAPVSIGSSSERPESGEGSGPSGPFNVRRAGLPGARRIRYTSKGLFLLKAPLLRAHISHACLPFDGWTLNMVKFPHPGIRPTTSLEEFFGEDIGLLDLTSQIELARQRREARGAQHPPNGAQYSDEAFSEGHPGKELCCRAVSTLAALFNYSDTAAERLKKFCKADDVCDCSRAW